MLVAVAAIPAAQGSIVFSFTNNGCSSGCSVLPAGTLTLTQSGANDVSVSVQLVSDYSFRGANDANHHALVFNITGSPAVTISGITSGGADSQTFSLSGPGSFNDSPFGTFGYALECDTCTPGMPGQQTTTLSFHLQATGLTESSFVATSGTFFAVDVVGKTAAAGVGLTGNIGAGAGTTGTGGDPGVPEPSTAAMLASGVGLIVVSLRRRKLTRP